MSPSLASLRRALVCLALLAPLAAQAESPARVASTEGQATCTAAGQAKPCAEGLELSQGDKVATGADGRLEVLLEDGTVVRVGPASEVEVSELSFEPESSTLKARFRLALGKVWAEVEKLAPEGRFEVATERAVAGVRGTAFRVDSDSAEGSVEVYHGKVAVQSQQLAYLGEAEGAPPEGPAALASAAEPGHGEVLVEPGRHLRLGAGGMRLYRQQRREDAFAQWMKGRPHPKRERFFKPRRSVEERTKDKEKRQKLRERHRERRSDRRERRRVN